MHTEKKLTSEEWVAEVRQGKLRKAIQSLRPSKSGGPWLVISDNESFLDTDEAARAHRRAGVRLWHVPPRSPDLNPVEKFWSWLRRRLQALDDDDVRQGRPPLGKKAYKQRVRRVCRSRRAQEVGAACANGLQKVCQEVIAKKGAATKG